MRFLAVLLLVVVTVAAATAQVDKSSRDQKICTPYEKDPGDPYCRCSNDGRAWLCRSTSVNSRVLSPREKRHTVNLSRCSEPGATKSEPGKVCTCQMGIPPRWVCRSQKI